jgi:hypothetical protein
MGAADYNNRCRNIPRPGVAACDTTPQYIKDGICRNLLKVNGIPCIRKVKPEI